MAGARVRAGMRIVTALIAAAGLSSAAGAAPRAVIELFTSQGCSSCPPADALLAKLAREPDLIALSLPVVASREVAIGRGENARRTVTYTNIVGDILPLGDWSGAPLRRTVSASTLKGYDGLVVLLQTGSPREPGAIIGAGRTALRSFPDRDAD